MNGNIKYLTLEDIVDATGTASVEEIEELEILFTTCDLLASLDRLKRLKRLSMLDNGLKAISGLEPVRMTLTVLSLCDQDITSIGKLDLPCLRELYLHRNRLKSLSGVSGCPKLRKLWAFQNNIEELSELQNLPDLEDLWVQANKITKLSGFDYSFSLVFIGIAGNPISVLGEVLKLSSLNLLQELSCSDIHFGKCTFVDDAGYKEFVITHLPQIHLLDGILITENTVSAAETLYIKQVQQFNAQLSALDEQHRIELQSIDYKRQGLELHNSTLEKELGTSLSDLESIVRGGRKAIDAEVVRQKGLLDANYDALRANVDALYNKVCSVIEDTIIPQRLRERSAIEAMFYLLEKVYAADGILRSVLVDAYECLNVAPDGKMEGKDAKESDRRIKERKMAFSTVSEGTTDFQYFSNLLSANLIKNLKSGLLPTELVEEKTGSLSLSPRMRDKISKTKSNGAGKQETLSTQYSVALLKLYRVCSFTSQNASRHSVIESFASNEASSIRVYTVVTPKMLSVIMRDGFEGLGSSLMLSTDPEVAVALFSCDAKFMLNNVLRSVDGDGDSQYSQDFEESKTDPSAPAVVQWLNESSFLLLLSCQLSVASLTLSSPDPISSSFGHMITIPENLADRRIVYDQCMQLCSTTVNPSKITSAPAVVMNTGIVQERANGFESVGSESKVFFLAPVTLSSHCQVEFVSVCITHALRYFHFSCSFPREIVTEIPNSKISWYFNVGHGTKSLENRLEMMLMTSLDSDKGSLAMSDGVEGLNYVGAVSRFTRDLSAEVKKFQELMLVDIDSVQANHLRAIDTQISKKDSDTRGVRSDIEKEKRLQEGVLREMRQITNITPAEKGNTGGSGSTKSRR